METFSEAGVSARVLEALDRQNITVPNSVQAQVIPGLMEGRDLVIQAPTGSGKTLAFLLPFVQRFRPGAPGPRGLVVVPTRELAVQVHGVLESLGTDLRSALLYGGVGYHTQTLALRGGADIVIGTPGRILDMFERKLFSLSRVEYMVLDEADQMFDAGFAHDMERIIGLTYSPQTVMASATIPAWVSRMVDRHLREPLVIKVELDVPSLLEHGLVRTERGLKLRLLSDILHQHSAAIVFGRTKHGVRKLNRELLRLGHRSVELQGNMAQPARDRVMESFRNRQAKVLVATNVAARGLDISHVEIVVNYDLPDTAEAMTHRIGRTARNGSGGRAITFLTADDHEGWAKLRRQGAPALPTVDAEALAGEGSWRHVEAAPLPVAAAAGSRPRSGPARRPRTRGWAGRPVRARRPALGQQPG